MDKAELVARLRALPTDTGWARAAIEELIADVEAEDVYTTLKMGHEPIVSQVARATSKPVDHFAEWIESDITETEKDFSVENPKLHALYTNWAHHHLLVMNKAIKRLNSFSNLNLGDTVLALVKCRKDLILGNAAYRDAAARIVAGIEPSPYIEDAAMAPAEGNRKTILEIIAELEDTPEDLGDYEHAIDQIRELIK